MLNKLEKEDVVKLLISTAEKLKISNNVIIEEVNYNIVNNIESNSAELCINYRIYDDKVGD